MRSDLRDNTETISKMIQFGTVKYGIVKQLKDRTRSERDVIGDQEDGSSMPCSPVAECKIFTPETEIQTNASSPTVLDCRVDDNENADHNHNNNKNIDTTDNHENEMHFENSEIKNEIPESFTYPEVELRKSPSPPTIQIPIPPAVGVSPPVDDGIVRDLNSSQDHNMSEDEHENEENEVNNHSQVGDYTDHISDHQPLKTVHADDAVVDEVHQQQHQQNHQQINNSRESPPPTLPQFPAAPITLEVIQNMQMAIAQFAAKTLANGGANNEAAMKQLAFLQQTLFNLQQQQIFQMQLIQQLQSQLALNQIKGDGEENNEDEEDIDEDEQICPENLSNHKSDDDFEDGLKDGEGMDTMSQDSQMHHRRLSDEERERENGLENDMSQSELEKGDSLKDEDGEYCDNGLSNDHQSHSSLLHNNNNNITSNSVNSQGLEKGEIRSPYSNKLDENTPLPYGSDLASSIITNHDDPPSLDGPNSLEMLQKRAQEVLDSASQGILSGNLADEFAFGKDKNGDCKNRNEPFFKHRCRYCGKVFGSDSALQIHIRSHTGERPFKCNVCGSRFTTKGNLKVHFQRHSQKFPHVPMNATPIPEHLDKFHPPLLEQMSPESSPPHQPQMPHVPNVPVSLPLPFPPGAAFPGLPLYRPPLEILKSLGHYPTPFFGALPPMPPITLKRDQECPTDLRKPSPPETTPPIKTQEIKEEPLSLRIKEEKNEVERDTPQIHETHQPRIPPPPPPELPPIQPPLALVTQPAPSPLERSQDIPQPPEAKRAKSTTPPPSVPQPPPLPPSLLQVSQSLLQQSVPPPPVPPQHSPLPTQQQLPPTTNQLPSLIKREDFAQRLPLNYTRLSPDRRSPIRSPANIPRSPFLGPLKHEMTLLPRPHSNDNSWENFIEVSNTSETVKLKELMKNKKLTDPNQCVVCDRVLSCKSALQMHYRTHTGERPFKCRICGRAFTTKGNLKTHMAVHKIRPPMRNFHQCPVCHKKYSNALVLQQHIRLHTGEPTDLTPEQIQAAEIRDFPPTMMPGSFLNPFTFNFGLGGGGHPNGMMGSESSQGENEEGMDCSDDFDDDISDHMSNGGFSDRPKSSDDMKGMLFEQKLKIENNRPKSEASTSSAPTSPVSAINKSSPTPSDTSQGALDLTPRSSMPPHTPPNHGPPLFHPRPPFGMFPNLPLFPPVSTTAQNMCSAMNSIAQSVMPSAPFNPLALSGVRGSTTCGICFKTFPCHSALEIHYRSHTKERPFKCSICDRGFTTKGNLKQHMLTHKIRDMEQDAFRNRAIKYSTEQEQR